MRYLYLITFFALFCFQSYAQNGIHYQAVVRDAGGTILNNVPVNVQVTIEPSAGTPYTENINAMTNDYGILNIVIGQNGNMDLKDFNWEFGDVTMDLEIEAGAKTIMIEDQPIQAVPYSYYSQLAQSAIDDAVEDADADPANELQMLSYDSSTQILLLSDGGAVQLTFEDKVEDADADPTNELQTLAFDSSSQMLMLSDGGTVRLAFEDKVEDADADPANELQFLSYDSLSRTLMLSDGGEVELPPLSSLWTDVPAGIYTEEDAYIGAPSDTPHLRLNPTIIDFRTESDDTSAQWTADSIFFKRGNHSGKISADQIEMDALVGPYNVRNTMDTAGFNSYIDIFNEKSTQFGGYFTAVKLPDSNNVFSQMNTSGLVIRNGMLSTTLDIGHLGIGGQWPVDYARLFGGGYGRLQLTNSNNMLSADLNTESGGGRLNLSSESSGVESMLWNNQLVFAEEGLGPYASLSGDGYGELELFNEANWSAIELQTVSGPGMISVKDGVGGNDMAVLDHNLFRILELEEYAVMDRNRFELGDQNTGPIVQLRSNNGSGKMYLHNAASWPVVEMGDMNGPGFIYLNGPSGNTNLELTNSDLSDNTGQIHLFENNALRFNVSTTLTGSGSGGFAALYGDNNRLNVLLTHLSGDATKGFITVYDENSSSQAGMYVDANGQGRIFADVKNFKMAHPVKSGTSIYYASLEGPEVAAYERGTARLKDGRVEVTFSEHFQIVANPETMTVMLTPHSSDTYGLAVIEKTATGFVVEELKKGDGNFSFDWEVKCKRRGYENWQVEQEDALNQPMMQKQ